MNDAKDHLHYWRANLKVLSILLTIWFLVSFGAGIVYVDELNQFQIGGFKFGFWMAQQGSIYVFVALIFAYTWIMNRIDRAYDVDERSH